MASTRPITPWCSCVPRPLGPMNPTACESSTMTMASWRSASSQISASGAMYPSIENTPSVTTNRNRASVLSCSWRSRSAMSRFAYRYRRALHRRMPSMMLAWLSASEMTASRSSRRASKIPPLASKHDE